MLLLGGGAVIDQGQGGDAGVAGVGHREGARRGDFFGGEHAGGLVKLKAAVFFRAIDHQQTEFPAFFHAFDHQIEVRSFNFIEMGENLVLNEIAGRFGDLLLFIAEIFGGEDVAAVGFGDQELAAFFQLFTHDVLAFVQDQKELKKLENSGRAHAAADAHADHAVFALAPFQFMQQSGGQFGPGAA